MSLSSVSFASACCQPPVPRVAAPSRFGCGASLQTPSFGHKIPSIPTSPVQHYLSEVQALLPSDPTGKVLNLMG
ncbi:MAG: hypothetical protein VKJ06_01490 [Vampirovibrionales bacterium]|nr:hypothetical protein [Vampirovibrionales bacterium]